mmetsp:Transcript_136324/g.423589  ORF Transcript_136324/g.423589 Transcript_136324/m.423589 type:complete len:208 (+) Transcript_136324:2034-2657(+)
MLRRGGLDRDGVHRRGVHGRLLHKLHRRLHLGAYEVATAPRRLELPEDLEVPSLALPAGPALVGHCLALEGPPAQPRPGGLPQRARAAAVLPGGALPVRGLRRATPAVAPPVRELGGHGHAPHLGRIMQLALLVCAAAGGGPHGNRGDAGREGLVARATCPPSRLHSELRLLGLSEKDLGAGASSRDGDDLGRGIRPRYLQGLQLPL